MNFGKNESDDWPTVDSAEDVIRGLRKHRNLTTFELCPQCGIEQSVYAFGISTCPDCGAGIIPCSMCRECRTPCVYEEIRNAGGGKGRRRR